MAVHVPLSIEAQMEARVLMMSTNNILSPAHGKPIIVPTQDIVLGLYYLTRERALAHGEGRVFSSPAEVRAAYDHHEVDLQAKITCRMEQYDVEGAPAGRQRVETTVGRVLLSDVLPRKIAFSAINKVMDKKTLGNLIDICYRTSGEKETVLLADRLRSLGYGYATKAGISIAIKDMVIPERKQELLERAQKEVAEIENQYLEGLITDGERYNKVIDIWAQVTEEVAGEMMSEIGTETVKKGGTEKKQPSFNPIFIMADSGARGSAQQIRQLAGMRGLMAKPSGEIIETPITANFREGLTVLQYFISTHGARKGLADTALKTANSGYLTRRLVDVAQDAIITEYDCGTMDGILLGALIEGGEIIEPMSERILGRVALDDVEDPFTHEVIVQSNEEIDEAKVKAIEEAGIERVKIRSVLTCQAPRGICVECYGRDLARGRKVNIGEAVGVIAAQSIGEPGTQLTMRTFHIGGTATRRAEASTIESRHAGTVHFHNLKTVKRKDGSLIVMNRNGEIAIADENGRERERYTVVYGAKLNVRDGQKIEAGTQLAEWDPFAQPIVAEVPGTVRFNDIIEGVTMNEQLDEVTGLSRKSIIESRDADSQPRLVIEDEKGNPKTLPGGDQPARYNLPVGANITVNDGDQVDAGEVIARIPRETTKTKDITGGLPRVAELFEARKPKEHAVISEIEGVVSFGKDTKGKRKVVVTPDIDGKLRTDMATEYLIGKGKHINVHAGDRVKAGDPLMDGAANPHDILKVLGEKELARYMVDEVQEVYRLQGVKINDKHIETIVRQMLRRVRVSEVGDTTFLIDEQVEKGMFDAENERVVASGGKPATGEPLLLGITKASLSTESFISASSFQETTKVLTEAAISGRVDYLRGLKENVIMGRLIPAGTGLTAYKHLDIEVETPVDEVEAAEEALAIAAGAEPPAQAPAMRAEE
jgi:DNA-directed RNA polymerase subunit beta'